MKHLGGIPGSGYNTKAHLYCDKKGINVTRGLRWPLVITWKDVVNVQLEMVEKQELNLFVATMFAGVAILTMPLLAPLGLLFKTQHQVPFLTIRYRQGPGMFTAVFSGEGREIQHYHADIIKNQYKQSTKMSKASKIPKEVLV
jgi:hypothetical protein